MTLHATRGPLQLIENPHIMSNAQKGGRRHSSRLAEKEDTLPNGLGHGYDTQSLKATAPTKASKASNATKNTSKRKPSYDEEDAGFSFTRTRAKKAKAEPSQPAISEEPAPPPHPEPVPQRKSKKRFEDRPSAATNINEPERSTRRSTRNSGGSPGAADPPTIAVKKRRKGDTADRDHTPAPEENVHRKTQAEQDHTRPVQIDTDSTQIALPFADTPIIRRNQEMRRGAGSGSRRSSLGMRGRRASSLIDTGKSNALPHDEVQTFEFYKHIESEGLSEPRRMKQLLTWCGTRALAEKPSFSSKDRDAVLAAREIQSQLLKDFSTKSSLSDWFSRDDEVAVPSPPKPNPKNAANLAKIAELEEQLASLKSSREAFTAFLSPPSIPSLPPVPTTQIPTPSEVDATLLPPPQQLLLQSLLPSQPPSETNPDNPKPTPQASETAHARVSQIIKTLEPSVDEFATSVHVLASYQGVAGRLAEEAIRDCGRILEGAERGEGDGEGYDVQQVGARDVLRALSRVER